MQSFCLCVFCFFCRLFFFGTLLICSLADQIKKRQDPWEMFQPVLPSSAQWKAVCSWDKEPLKSQKSKHDEGNQTKSLQKLPVRWVLFPSLPLGGHHRVPAVVSRGHSWCEWVVKDYEWTKNMMLLISGVWAPVPVLSVEYYLCKS